MISNALLICDLWLLLLKKRRKIRRPKEIGGQGKCHMDSRVKITDSKIYVLWLAKQKGGKRCIHDGYTLAF